MPLADAKSLRSQQVSQWFSNPVFSEICLQQDADEEMNRTAVRGTVAEETEDRDDDATTGEVAMETE